MTRPLGFAEYARSIRPVVQPARTMARLAPRTVFPMTFGTTHRACGGLGSNNPKITRSLLISRAQGPVPVHGQHGSVPVHGASGSGLGPSAHARKCEPLAGTAVRVTVAPSATFVEQIEPQSIPLVPVMVPIPWPLVATVSIGRKTTENAQLMSGRFGW